jgi:hypothetical protein
VRKACWSQNINFRSGFNCPQQWQKVKELIKTLEIAKSNGFKSLLDVL